MDKLRNELEQTLLEQLKKHNTNNVFFIDLVGDYMALWDIKNQLIKDIEEKGVSVKYQNGENQYGYKKNESVSELNRVNSQMLKILRELEIKATPIKLEDDEKFEL